MRCALERSIQLNSTHVLLSSGSDLSAAQYAPPFLLFMRGGRPRPSGSTSRRWSRAGR